MNIDTLTPVALLKALADPSRLQAMLLIQAHDALCVCELQQALGMSQPKVSRHLAELRAAGLVTDERRGRWVYYRLQTLPEWAHAILGGCAQAQPVLPSVERVSCCD